MHATTPCFARKTTIFFKHEVLEVVAMVTQYFILYIFKTEKKL
jgi:hypothetical protein